MSGICSRCSLFDFKAHPFHCCCILLVSRSRDGELEMCAGLESLKAMSFGSENQLILPPLMMRKGGLPAKVLENLGGG